MGYQFLANMKIAKRTQQPLVGASIMVCVVALSSAVVAGCGKKAESSATNEGGSQAAQVTIDLNSGSKPFNCKGFTYGMSGTGLREEMVKVKADSIDEATKKSKSYFEQKKWTADNCVENTLDTASTKAQVVAKDQYKEVAKGADLLYLYHANNDAAVPYEEIAKSQFSSVANETDVFKRQEALGQLKGTIDKNIAEKKGLKFISFSMNTDLSHFDMTSQTFSVPKVQLGNGAYYQFFDGNGAYRILMNGDTGLLTFKPKSIDDAKAIESSIKGTSKPVVLTLYGQIMKAAEMNQEKFLVVEVTGASVYDVERSGRASHNEILTTMK